MDPLAGRCGYPSSFDHASQAEAAKSPYLKHTVPEFDDTQVEHYCSYSSFTDLFGDLPSNLLIPVLRTLSP
jgi:hypothetical protein